MSRGQKIKFGILAVILLALSLVLGFHYLPLGVKRTSYLLFSCWCFWGALSVAASYLLWWGNQKGSLKKTMLIITVLLEIPVLVCGIIWLLYFCGISLLPPPQR